MPNRIIKESICTSDSINGLSWFEEVLFYRLIVACDDFGRYDGRIAVIKNKLFPLKESLTAHTVEMAVDKLVSAGLVALYVHEGKPFLYLPTWNDHQSIRAKKSKYPAPEDSLQASASICNHLHADVPVIQSNPIQSESNANANKRTTGKRFVPPTLEEVQEYCRERGNAVDARRFVDHYSSNGWKVGKNAMKDWRAAVRTWERNGLDAGKKPAGDAIIKSGTDYSDIYK